MYQFTGLNVLMYYCPQIFQDVGVRSRRVSLLISAGIGLWNTINSFIPFFLVDRFGRKPLAMFGSLGQTISMLLIALSYKLDISSSASFALTLVGFLLFFTMFVSGIGTLFFIIINEIYPPSISAFTASACQFFMRASNIAILHIFPPMVDLISQSGFFFLLTGFCGLTFLFCLFVFYETRNRECPEPPLEGEEEDTTTDGAGQPTDMHPIRQDNPSPFSIEMVVAHPIADESEPSVV